MNMNYLMKIYSTEYARHLDSTLCSPKCAVGLDHMATTFIEAMSLITYSAVMVRVTAHV